MNFFVGFYVFLELLGLLISSSLLCIAYLIGSLLSSNHINGSD